MFLSKDEPFQRDGAIVVPLSWDASAIMRVWPAGERYRVKKFHTGRLGLQSYKDGGWWNMFSYDDGRDEYGKLYPGRWKPLEHDCMWTVSDLDELIARIKKASYISSKARSKKPMRKIIIFTAAVILLVMAIRYFRRKSRA